MENKKVNFIIVDDSELDCFIAEKLVRHAGVGNKIKSFLRASDALDYIKKTNSIEGETPTVVLVDILMPIMSGVEFVEEFEKLPFEVREKYYIVAFTSSMNKKDMGAMKSYDSVKFLFDKPLSPEVLSSLQENCRFFS
ncbi:two-component system response regulator [Paradesertivirga mongoliensis]|uniref:Two-component system response regulator n=1 Tax=Paradesertivirga mongoliensis TaxID=2100740 RepID=A0ABW4ZNN2_9SPHI|nr:response regulator [Pedobacter mongoliensis]